MNRRLAWLAGAEISGYCFGEDWREPEARIATRPELPERKIQRV